MDQVYIQYKLRRVTLSVSSILMATSVVLRVTLKFAFRHLIKAPRSRKFVKKEKEKKNQQTVFTSSEAFVLHNESNTYVYIIIKLHNFYEKSYL